MSGDNRNVIEALTAVRDILRTDLTIQAPAASPEQRIYASPVDSWATIRESFRSLPVVLVRRRPDHLDGRFGMTMGNVTTNWRAQVFAALGTGDLVNMDTADAIEGVRDQWEREFDRFFWGNRTLNGTVTWTGARQAPLYFQTATQFTWRGGQRLFGVMLEFDVEQRITNLVAST